MNAGRSSSELLAAGPPSSRPPRSPRHAPIAGVGAEIAQVVPRLAASSVTVLIEGETGVGKTFVARLIHETGARAAEPLRTINCAAVPESLLEAELFGHERGAFSGAVAPREGALEAAGAGTVLLDEIGDLALPNQAKLLRALEERRFERLGSNRTVPLRARILVATNCDLGAMVAAGRFRSDLFFRISVVPLRIPPLRHRGDDLLSLAMRVLEELNRATGRRVGGFAPDAVLALRRHAWPGNIRELRNAIEHALLFGDGALVRAADLPTSVRGALAAHGSATSTVTLPAPLEWLEQRAIEEALRVAGGSRSRAAAILGITPGALYYRLRALARRR